MNLIGIFISGVRPEFVEERAALRDYLRGDPLMQRFFDPFLFEDVPATDPRPDDLYLDEVERCDLYLGLFGQDYGTEDEQGISPTEREFDHAAALDKHRLIFVKSVSDDARHPKMQALIGKARAGLIRRRFSTTTELVSGLYDALVDYLDRKDLIRQGPFDASPCMSARLEHLDEERMTTFIRTARRARQFRLPEDAPAVDLLAHLNLLNDERPTNAAVLLFGKTPQRFLLSSEVKCAHFHGTQVAKPIPSYQVYKGTAFELVDQAVDFVLSKINRSIGTRAESVQAPRTYEIPPEVVTEAIVNAVAHRDYTNNGSVQVMLFADRLEVRNPGRLRPPLTLEKLRVAHRSVPGNPLLAESLYLAEYIERMGTGTLDMIRRCLDAGLQEPEFEAAGEFVTRIRRPAGTVKRSDLLELIAGGENSGLEFKRDDLRPEQLAREVVALANFQGGRLLLGVEDDGTVTGVQRGDLERWVMDTVFGQMVHPMILPFYEEVPIDAARRVAVITVTQGATKPYVVRHRGREDIYVRVGSTSRLASREQQARLFAASGLVHTELLPVSGSGLRDLSRDRLSDYLTAIVGDRDAPATDDAWHAQLCALGFMVEREDGPPVCTIAGLVLFGYRPRRLLRHAGFRWICFKSAARAYDALDDQVLEGPLVDLWRVLSGGRERVEKGLIERLADVMRPFVSEEAGDVDESMRRERRWHYPLDALREGIVNALTHRDWTRYEEIEVIRYGDRIEITSPGALQNGMTIEKMIAGQRVPRNLLISETLRDYRYSDARGMGVRNKIIPSMRAHNGVDPEFEATEDYLRLTLRRRPPNAVLPAGT